MGTVQPARRLRCALVLACLIAIALIAIAAPLSSARAAAPISWTNHASAAQAEGPLSLSCPSESLCVAVDRAGRALAGSDAISAAPTWSAMTIDSGNALTSVSCPTEALCVAVDEAGDALVSTAPAAGEWGPPTAVDAGHALGGVSCASPTLCAAVGEDGTVFVSTAPSTGEWSAAAPIETGHPLTGVSCASPTLCVAVDEDGYVLSSNEPANAATAWSTYPTGAALGGVSCEPSGVCVAYAGTTAFASADPGSPDTTHEGVLGPTWSATTIDHSPLTHVSCAASGLCVALDEEGGALASDNPTSAIPLWEASTPSTGGETPLEALTCLPGGVCVAVGAPAGGGTLTSFRGSVPPPEAGTGGGHATGASKAKVAGTVNPHDATLASCVVQYGTSTAYGGSAPCEAMPTSTNSAQSVSAMIEGLSPNTVYHYRIVATDGAGEGIGADRTVKTLPPPALVYPKPTISGKPIAGHQLTCQAHLPPGAKASLAYVWLRGLSPIEGQVKRRYKPTAADAGHHLQCQVTATNEGGSVTRTSPFVAIPIKGVLAAVGETAVVHANLRHTRVEVAVSCSKLATQGCVIEAKLTVRETLRGRRLIAVAAHAPRRRGAAARRHHAHAAHAPHRRKRAAAARRRRAATRRRGHGAQAVAASHRRIAKKRRPPKTRHRTVTIGSAHVSIEPNHDRVVKVFLDRAGRKLLRRRSEGVQAQLTVIGTVVGVLKTRLRREVLSLAPRRPRRLRAARSRA